VSLALVAKSATAPLVFPVPQARNPRRTIAAVRIARLDKSLMAQVVVRLAIPVLSRSSIEVAALLAELAKSAMEPRLVHLAMLVKRPIRIKMHALLALVAKSAQGTAAALAQEGINPRRTRAAVSRALLVQLVMAPEPATSVKSVNSHELTEAAATIVSPERSATAQALAPLVLRASIASLTKAVVTIVPLAR
jgi:hypothetical protein